jgi:hypothetical protein
MANSYQTTNLSPGMVAFHPGIYEVAHFNPEHAAAHEVLVSFGLYLPKCSVCVDNVRFSLKLRQPEPIRDNPFFRTLGSP